MEEKNLPIPESVSYTAPPDKSSKFSKKTLVIIVLGIGLIMSLGVGGYILATGIGRNSEETVNPILTEPTLIGNIENMKVSKNNNTSTSAVLKKISIPTPTSSPTSTPTPSPTPTPTPTLTPTPTITPTPTPSLPTLTVKKGEELKFSVNYESKYGEVSGYVADSSYLKFNKAVVSNPQYKIGDYVDENWYFETRNAGETKLEINRYYYEGGYKNITKQFFYRVIIEP